MASDKGDRQERLWLADNPGKRWAEVLYLAYSPFWITWALCIVVPFQLYERCNEAGYLLIGLGAALPCVLLPPLVPGNPERARPWHQQYWVRLNVWMAVLSFVGNYLWTHYFYRLLGARYTFPSWQLNAVPIPLYLMTHAYFCFYHTLANLVLRRVRRAARPHGAAASLAATAAAVFLLAYATAFMETLTIAHFPHYTFQDRASMYTWGSLFYAIYFFVSFPAFFAMDEAPGRAWTCRGALVDALAACMAVTLLLDAWRLVLGDLATLSGQAGREAQPAAAAQSLPWLA